MDSSQPDQLLLLTVSGSQTEPLLKRLKQEEFNFTVIDSAGGVMQEPATCLLIGFHHERLPVVLNIVRETCHPYRQYIPAQGFLPGESASLSMVEASLGGALVYMMDVERFEQF